MNAGAVVQHADVVDAALREGTDINLLDNRPMVASEYSNILV